MAYLETKGFRSLRATRSPKRPIIIGATQSLTKAQMGNNRVSPSWSLREQEEIPWFIMVTVDKP